MLRNSLARRFHCVEFGEAFGVVAALFEEVDLGLAHSHLVLKLEEALPGIVEDLEADGLEF